MTLGYSPGQDGDEAAAAGARLSDCTCGTAIWNLTPSPSVPYMRDIRPRDVYNLKHSRRLCEHSIA